MERLSLMLAPVALALAACAGAQSGHAVADPLVPVASYVNGDIHAEARVDVALAQSSIRPITVCTQGCTVHVAPGDAHAARSVVTSLKLEEGLAVDVLH